jgi:hypothetical protein
MYVEESTNGRWLSLDPREQIADAVRQAGSEQLVRERYREHGITDAAFNILQTANKSRQHFYDFINERESFFSGQLEHYGFRRPAGPPDSDLLDDDDDR